MRAPEKSTAEWQALKAAQGGKFTPAQQAELFGDADLAERKRRAWLAEVAAQEARKTRRKS